MDAAPLNPVRLRPETGRGCTGIVTATVDERADGGVWDNVRLPYRAPLALAALIGFLADRAVPGVEHVVGGQYRRVLRLPGGLGLMALAADDGAGGPGDRTTAAGDDALAAGDERWIACRLRLDDPGDRPVAVAACRRLLDLDADPVAVDAALGADPLLAPLVAATPGRRAPGHVDAAELAVRAVLGQQVSLVAARRLAGRLAALCGEPLTDPVGDLTTAFPSPAAIAEADLDQIGMPEARRTTVRTLARALADGEISLEPGVDADEAERALLGIRGIGPWTAAYIRMRGLADRDVFLATDLGVRHGLAALGTADAATVDERWRPWRSYAVQHLWASLA
jgi:AraC family transcriptional regulator, regulatory protein of adaptative response / DNA-3-methyladenine glycosylase II